MNRICNKCVMTTADKDIKFDRFGVCNHCFNWRRMNRQRLFDLEKKDKVLSFKGKKYDCLIGLSGGVDSSTALYELINMGKKVFAFSMDNGWNTKESDENVMRMVEGLKVPFYRYKIDISKFKELQMAFLQSGISNVEIPTDHIITAASYEMANRYGIKTIISGGNIATEGIMPESFGYQPRDLKFIKAVYKKFTGKRLSGLPTMSIWKYIYYRFIKKIKVINILDYYDYNRAESIKLLIAMFGYKPYGAKHCENFFTMWFQNYYLPKKFEMDKRRPHLSSMINSEQITRQEALKELEETLKYPEIPELEKYIDTPKKEYTDYPHGEKMWTFLSNLYAYFK